MTMSLAYADAALDDDRRQQRRDRNWIRSSFVSAQCPASPGQLCNIPSNGPAALRHPFGELWHGIAPMHLACPQSSGHPANATASPMPGRLHGYGPPVRTKRSQPTQQPVNLSPARASFKRAVMDSKDAASGQTAKAVTPQGAEGVQQLGVGLELFTNSGESPNKRKRWPSRHIAADGAYAT